jgi:hypothetical protein
MLLTQFLQIGLLDKLSFANLIGRGNQDDVFEAVRRYAKESAEAERVAAQQQSQAMQQQAQQQQSMQQQALDTQKAKVDADLMGKMISAQPQEAEM